jgi:hypothetical protein
MGTASVGKLADFVINEIHKKGKITIMGAAKQAVRHKVYWGDSASEYKDVGNSANAVTWIIDVLYGTSSGIGVFLKDLKPMKRISCIEPVAPTKQEKSVLTRYINGKLKNVELLDNIQWQFKEEFRQKYKKIPVPAYLEM